MLHLCNITAGVWGRYAGEDTRPLVRIRNTLL
jgi:hypothetical protein